MNAATNYELHLSFGQCVCHDFLKPQEGNTLKNLGFRLFA